MDALVNLTGFSLVGGPASQDAKKAKEVLMKLNRPYMAARNSFGSSFQVLNAISRAVNQDFRSMSGSLGFK